MDQVIASRLLGTRNDPVASTRADVASGLLCAEYGVTRKKCSDFTLHLIRLRLLRLHQRTTRCSRYDQRPCRIDNGGCTVQHSTSARFASFIRGDNAVASSESIDRCMATHEANLNPLSGVGKLQVIDQCDVNSRGVESGTGNCDQMGDFFTHQATCF